MTVRAPSNLDRGPDLAVKPRGDGRDAIVDNVAAAAAAEARAASQPTRYPAKITANIDGFDPRGYLAGWAWVPDHPRRRVAVSAYVDTDLVSFGTANSLREDVQKAGFGDGRYGFSLPFPDRMLDGRTQKLSVQFEASGAKLHAAEVELTLPSRSVATAAPPPAGDQTAPAVAASPPQDGEHRTGAVYMPGRYVTCTALHPRPPYHTEGWCRPEQDFTWIDGIEAAIEMTLRRPLDSYTLTLDVVPNPVGDRLQTLEIFANYFRVGFFEVREPATLSVELPAELFILRKTRIQLHCREALVPSEHGVPDDNRRLGIAVAGWCIG